MSKDKQTTQDKENKALAAAVSAIYFDDSSDYLTALWEVVAAIDKDALELLDEDPQQAYEKYGT